MPRLVSKFLTFKVPLIIFAAALAVAAAHTSVRLTFYAAARGRQDGGGLSHAGKSRNVPLSRASLWPQLRPALDALGDRMERRGKERLTVAGTLAREHHLTPAPFVLVREFPGRLRMAETGPSGRRVFVYQAGEEGRSGREREEWESIETLLFDTAEHFLSAQASGAAATRLVGQRVRPDDGDNTGYTGPYYVVYQVTEGASRARAAAPRTKFFLFNADTMLLERVRYRITVEGGAEHSVEVFLSDWERSDGQAAPRKIVRLVDGKPTLSLTITTVALGARADDGAFAAQ